LGVGETSCSGAAAVCSDHTGLAGTRRAAAAPGRQQRARCSCCDGVGFRCGVRFTTGAFACRAWRDALYHTAWRRRQVCI